MLNKRGQSTIEFLLTIVFSVGFLLMFISLAVNITSGYMAHYATFVASRAYMVADNYGINPESYAQRIAKLVFKSFKLDKKYFIEKGSKLSILPAAEKGSRVSKVFVGLKYEFKQKLFFSFVVGNKKLNLVSESFLGKEPTRQECKRRICEIMTYRIGYPSEACTGTGGQQHHLTYFDNGC